MGKYRNTIFYTIVIIIACFLMYFTVHQGRMLEKDVVDVVSDKSNWEEFLISFTDNLHHPLALLLFQIVAIVIVARIFGWFFNKIGQPSVIGEIIAGIVLGPSFFGVYFPGAWASLFPVESIGKLNLLSPVGLILFVFVVGMELDLKVVNTKANEAVVISHSSVVIPF